MEDSVLAYIAILFIGYGIFLMIVYINSGKITMKQLFTGLLIVLSILVSSLTIYALWLTTAITLTGR